MGSPRAVTPLGAELNPAIANHAVHLAVEWGENWLKPVQSRLSRVYPSLTKSELDAYDRVAREVIEYGNDLVLDVLKELGPESPSLHSRWHDELAARAPWVSQENLGRLFSQGMYYSMK